MALKPQWRLLVDWSGDKNTFKNYVHELSDLSDDLLSCSLSFGRDIPNLATGKCIVGELTAIVKNDGGKYTNLGTQSQDTLITGIRVQLKVSLPDTKITDRVVWSGTLDKFISNVKSDDFPRAELRANGPLWQLAQVPIIRNYDRTRTKSGRAVIETLLEAGATYSEAQVLLAHNQNLNSLEYPTDGTDNTNPVTIDEGVLTFRNWLIPGVTPLTFLRALEDVEVGTVEESRAGYIGWQGRAHRLASNHSTKVRHTFDNTIAEGINYQFIERIASVEEIVNSVSVQTSEITEMLEKLKLAELRVSVPPGAERELYVRTSNDVLTDTIDNLQLANQI